jgi:hypothetical protein
MQVNVRAVIRHPFNRQAGLHHGVAESVHELPVHRQEIMDQHKAIVARFLMLR